MIRLVFILLVAALIGLSTAWLADHDGLLMLTIAGYEIRTSAAVGVVLFVLLTFALFLLVQLAFLILGGPSKLSAFLTTRRARMAWHALSRGLVAAAADDTEDAVQAARHAEKLLGGQALTLLLSAQAAELSGDTQRQEAVYRAMLTHSETEFLGLRKLFALAMRRGTQEEALGLAQRAHALKPKEPHAAESLFGLRIARCEWQEAEALFTEAMAAKILTPEAEGRWRDALSSKNTVQPAAVSLEPGGQPREPAPEVFQA